MRHAHLIFLANALFSGGCSVFIASSGMDLQPLATRQQVHEKFGAPAAIGDDNDFEEYRLRRKLSHFYRASGNGMGFAMTAGLSEFIAFPSELYLLARNALVGQNLRFEYDEFGNVDHVLLDGELPCQPVDRKAAPTSTVSADAMPEK